MTNSNPKWSSKKTLLAQLQKSWDKGILLRDCIENNNLFPMPLKFKSPGSNALAHEFDAVRCWVAEIQRLSAYRIVYKTRYHRIIGENSLPCEAWVDTRKVAIELLGKQPQLDAFLRLLNTTRKRAPWLIDWVRQFPFKALNLSESWSKLIDFICWRQQHPQPGIYLRQVSLRGIDSKFIEQHRSTLAQLLDLSLPPSQINREKIGSRQFPQRYGFRNKPPRLRFRPLDARLALLPGTDHDISLSVDDANALQLKPQFINHIQHIFITENEINYLSFPPANNSVVIFGAGYGFEALEKIGWLGQRQIFYWGDIDTHGFAILDQLRSKFPNAQSLLMDEPTLVHHREFWGEEDKPRNGGLQRLNPSEQKLYQSLIYNTHHPRLRLEQERISFEYLMASLPKIRAD